MQSGRLRHRIDFQTNAGTADAAGQVVDSWSDTYTNEPAEVIETGGAEALFGHRIDATATHVVRCRYRAGLSEEMQIVWGSRTLGIVNVRDYDGRRRELWITCREVK